MEQPEPRQIAETVQVYIHALCQKTGVSLLHCDFLVQLLVESYTQPGRFYHNLAHIHDMYELLIPVGLGVCTNYERLVLEWSIWFHDIIYTPQSNRNEEESAELACKTLSHYTNLDNESLAGIKQLILATKTHTLGDGDEHWRRACESLLDCDLGILAASPDKYEKYVDGIRKEYSHFSDEDFRTGRIRVLRNLLEKQSLYCTAYGKRALEAPARENILHELQKLAK